MRFQFSGMNCLQMQHFCFLIGCCLVCCLLEVVWLLFSPFLLYILNLYIQSSELGFIAIRIYSFEGVLERQSAAMARVWQGNFFLIVSIFSELSFYFLRAQLILYIFLMLCCFSKKKKKPQHKERPLPLKKKSKACAKEPVLSLDIIPQKMQEQSQVSNCYSPLIIEEKSSLNISRYLEAVNVIIKEETEAEVVKYDEGQLRKKQHPKFSDIKDQNEKQESGENNSDPFQSDQMCDLSLEEQCQIRGPKRLFKQTHSFEELDNLQMETKKSNESLILSKKSNWSTKTFDFQAELDQIVQDENESVSSSLCPKQTAITLENFHEAIQQLHMKTLSQLDDPLDETYQEAENNFYCAQAELNQQFSRAVIAYPTFELAKSLLERMTVEEKNKVDKKGYTPVQLVVVKALSQPSYVQLAKFMAYQQEIQLECKSPSGWTPLQQALIYRNIPISTHLFKAGYMKRQSKFKRGLEKLKELLDQLPDFTIDIEVSIDSFIPLIGALAPSDTLKIRKVGSKINLDYSLVGYQFPLCKRRMMSLYFDGQNMLSLNHSKGIYCDLLQNLDQQQMVLLIEDLLIGQIKRGQPIMHQVSLTKSLSLFDNEIKDEIGGHQATKYSLNLLYTSTAEKKKSNTSSLSDLQFASDYGSYQQRNQEMVIKEKNRNKKLELEVWLAPEFGLNIEKFVHALDILGAGNNLLSKWSGFLKQKIGKTLKSEALFPIKIEIPLNYSLYFNIQFCNYSKLEPGATPLQLDPALRKIQRKQFQGLLESRQKRKLLLEAYT